MHRYRKISKFFSYVLRHNPEKIGIQPDDAGWVAVDELIIQSRKNGMNISRDDIKAVIEQSDKTRFALSADGKYIRATYGHSIDIDLGYEPKEPPRMLYHGTAVRNLESIRQSGIHPQNRQYVHLSADRKSAIQVGQRHGKPVVLNIPAKQMYRDGFIFYQPVRSRSSEQSDTGIWLTKQVPASYISTLKDPEGSEGTNQ